MTRTRGEDVRPVFEELFDRYGLPAAIQTDNGSPFASTRALGGLTPLSAWWVSRRYGGGVADRCARRQDGPTSATTTSATTTSATTTSATTTERPGGRFLRCDEHLHRGHYNELAATFSAK